MEEKWKSIKDSVKVHENRSMSFFKNKVALKFYDKAWEKIAMLGDEYIYNIHVV